MEATPTRLGVRAWFTLGMLCFVYVLNFLDRQLLSILAKPIQDTLHVTDGQLGRIGGLYFALFYCLIGVPVGWLADRTNRTRLVSLACALWSGATTACGLAANFPQLVAARMAVGVGEAGGVPPSYAIITDYFPPGRRGTALSIFNLGPPIGQALGVAFGASIAAAYSWRQAFIVLGGVGVLTAVATLLTMREPKRGGLDPAATPKADGSAAAAPAFWATVRMFFGNPALVLAATAGGRDPDHHLRRRQLHHPLPDAGEGHEPASRSRSTTPWSWRSAWAAGSSSSGRIIDRFTRRSRQAFAIVPAVTLALAAPPFVGFVWAPTWPVALAVPDRADLPQLLLSLVVGGPGAADGGAAASACSRAPCCCW